MKDPNPPKLGDLEYRVALCRQQDIVADGQTMELHRAEVIWTWARIKTYYFVGATLNTAGYEVLDLPGTQRRPTHTITFRHGTEVELTAMAWIYEQPRKSPPRWYKVLAFSESVNWINAIVKLMERSDDAQVPHKMLMPQSARVDI